MSSTQAKLFSLLACCLALSAAMFSSGLAPALAADDNVGGIWTRARFEHFSVEQGLSQSTVRAILQDRQGFLWFGTEDGLNRYDGYSFTVFKPIRDNPNSLTHNQITALLEDRDGLLWIGTSGGGLDRFDPKQNRFDHYRDAANDPRASGSDYVNVLLQDQQGVIWVGTDGGLNAYDYPTRRLIRYNADADRPGSLSSDRVTALHEDRQGFLWVGTERGLNRFHRDLGTFSTYGSDPADSDSLSGEMISAIFEDRDGSLWVGTDCAGLNRRDSATGAWRQYHHDPSEPESLSSDCIRFIDQDRAGTIWIGTTDGLNRLDGERFVVSRSDPRDPSSLGANSLLAFLEDRSDVLWIGTYGAGVSKLDRLANRFEIYRNDPYDTNSLSDNQVRAFAEDLSGNLWVATDGGGLDRFDRTQDQVTHYRHIPANPDSLAANRVRALYLDRAGALWVGTYSSGLDRYSPVGDTFLHYRYDPVDSTSLSSNAVRAMVEDADGILWIGTEGGGLNALDLKADQFTRYTRSGADRHGFSSNIVRTLYLDSVGRLWVGTADSGLFRRDPGSKTFTRYRVGGPDGLPGPLVMSIHQDRRGTMWIGTFGGGLCELHEANNSFTCYTKKEGLPNDVIYGVLEDEQGDLWLSTNQGLSHFSPQTMAFINYSAIDGLQSNEFNGNAYYRSPSGEMFFGGINGFNSFRPRVVRQKNAFIPPIVLTSLTQANESLAESTTPTNVRTVVLSWPQNFFEFEFAALSFTRPEKNSYAYKLDGFRNEGWNYIGSKRFGRYTNLPGGKYVLRLKGANSDGVWNEEGIAIEITVVPPLWEMWWVRGLALLGIVGGIAIGYRWRVRNVEARARELEMQVAQRTHEVEGRRQEIAALYQADEQLYSDLRLEKVLQTLADITVNILAADKAAVLTWDQGHERLRVRVAQGFSEEALRPSSFPCGQTLAAHVAATGSPAIVENAPMELPATGESAEALQVLAAEGIHSILHLPIKVDGQVYGVFCIAYIRAHAFNEDQQHLFGALVQRAARAIENARYFDAEYRRAEQFRVIAEVGRQTAVLGTIDSVLEHIVRLIQQAFGYYHVGIGLVEGDDVVYRVGAGILWDDANFAFKPQRLKIGSEGITGWVAKAGQPLVASDVRADDRYVWMQGSATLSEIVVPVLIQGTVVGVLDAQSDRLNAFDETDLSVMQSLANQIAATLENARHLEAEHRRAEQFRTINEMGQRINTMLPVKDLLEKIATLVQGAFDFSHVGIGLVEGDEIVAKAEAGVWGQVYGPIRLKIGAQGIWGWVAATGVPMLVPDVRREPRYYWVPGVPDVRSQLCVPMKAGTTVIGVMSIEGEHENAFDASDLAVLQSLANQAAIAVENARLFEDSERQVARLTALQETARAVASTLEQDTLLRLIIEQATSLMQADCGMINLVDWQEHDDNVVAATGVASALLGSRGSLEGSLSGWVTLHKQPTIANELEKDVRVSRSALDWVAENGIESAAIAPLIVKDRVVGTLAVLGARGGKGGFDQADLDLLVAFANQAAVAIENAQLYEQAQQVAVSQERGRLARDLHDAVTQTLFSATLIAEALPEIWMSDQAEGKQLLQELRQLSRGALAEMRTLLLELRPAALMEANLDDLLRQLAEAAAGRAGVEVRVRFEGKGKLPDEVHVALYRITQEALNNVVKHARATTVTVSLQRMPASEKQQEEAVGAVLIIADDGRGFDPASVPPDHLGLGIIRERAEAIGANLRLESQPGGGTRLEVIWPNQVAGPDPR